MDLKRIAKSLEPLVVKTNYQRNMDVYARENAKIRRVLQGAVVPAAAASEASGELAAVFELARVETRNAIVLQRFWARCRVRQAWKLRARQAWLVLRIQSLARGVITRRLVAAWCARCVSAQSFSCRTSCLSLSVVYAYNMSLK
jgi:hypothetical protein